jgi:glucose uptake protein GlcU
MCTKVWKLFALGMPALIIYIAGMKTTQYTVRNIPEQVDRLVRQQAKKSIRTSMLFYWLFSNAGSVWRMSRWNIMIPFRTKRIQTRHFC